MDTLGKKNLPGTLDGFQRMKYTDTERYGFVRLDYRRRQELLEHPERALPNVGNVVIDDRKFTGYLFNPDSKKGWSKGNAIQSRLGYDVSNYQEMIREIKKQASQNSATPKGNAGYGDKYEQKIVVYGKKGSPANVIVGWIVEDDYVRLTSAYIKEV